MCFNLQLQRNHVEEFWRFRNNVAQALQNADVDIDVDIFM